MGTVDFERAVLRELDQIRGLIVDGLREAQRANGTLDEELSELRLKVALLEKAEPKAARSWVRDGGLVLTPSLLIPLAQALISALQTAPPSTPTAPVTPPPAAIVQPLIPGP